MAKKLLIFFIVFLVISSLAFSQEQEQAPKLRHMVYGGYGFGWGVPAIFDMELFVAYHFSIIPQLSVGVSVAGQYYMGVILAILFEALATGDTTINSAFGPVAEGQLYWYPWAKTFYIGIGLGYSYYLLTVHTLLVAPGLGWRIDFGRPGGFIMNIGLRAEIFNPIGDSFWENSEGNSFRPVNFLAFRLGFGYRF